MYQVVNLLAETQEQLRKQRKRGMPTVRGGSLFPSMGAAPQPDSIASELESSLYSELSIDSGIGAGDRMYVTKLHLILLILFIRLETAVKFLYLNHENYNFNN